MHLINDYLMVMHEAEKARRVRQDRERAESLRAGSLSPSKDRCSRPRAQRR